MASLTTGETGPQLEITNDTSRIDEVFLSSFFDARPRCYAITAKGLRLLADADMPINVAPKKANITLAHEIECAETMFLLASAVATHGLQLIDEPELTSVMPESTQQLSKPLRLQAHADPRDFPLLDDVLDKPTTIAFEPDRLFALALPDNTAWSFSLELCRSTEDISARRIKGKTTHLRRLIAYTSAWLSGAHTAQWGAVCKSLRVLILTTSETRIHNMLAIQERVAPPPGLFLYSTPARLQSLGPLGPAWISSKRDDISLLDRA